MSFNRDEVSALLVRCHRRCCICHRFCGVKIETDHIVPTNDEGGDDIDNAIPVCFECHAEIHSYNDKHPRGRKFSPEELRRHREQWLEICAKQPGLLVDAIRDADVGPIQALIDELKFNAMVASVEFKNQGCKFHDRQFLRAIHEGSISLLRDNIRDRLLDAYREMGAANAALESKGYQSMSGEAWAQATSEAQRRMIEARGKITDARNELLKFLSSDGGW